MRRICKYCGQAFDWYPGALGCPECVDARRRQVVRLRTCQKCGVSFPGGPRAWYCPACRIERRRQHDREAKQRKKAGLVRSIGSTAYCERCGEPYTVNSGLQRYCPECAPEAVREAANALSRAWDAAHTTPEGRRIERRRQAAEIPCRMCGKLFVPASAAVTCSPECSEALARQTTAAWETSHREARNAYRRQRRADRLAAMTEEERQAYRDKINARARENYRKRKEREHIPSTSGTWR